MSLTVDSSASAFSRLVKLNNGEYTAASVAADPKDASRLGLVKQIDGAYAAPPATRTAAHSLSAVTAMRLGGA